MAVNVDPEHSPEKSFGKDIEETGENTSPPHKGHTSQKWENYPKNKIALPTVGRMVYYYHYSHGNKEMAAIVAGILPGSGLTINASVVSRLGAVVTAGVQDIPHESERPTPSSHYWDWMPFQKGQTAKTEELQRKLEETSVKLEHYRGPKPNLGPEAK